MYKRQSETPAYIGRAVAALAADPDIMSKTGGSYATGGLAKEYGFTDLNGTQPDFESYFREHQAAFREHEAATAGA